MDSKLTRLVVPQIQPDKFWDQVHSLITDLEMQAADIRYRFRLAKGTMILVTMPVNMELLPVFLAASMLFAARDIEADWSKWFEGQ